MKRLLIALLMPLSAAAYTDADITRDSACGAEGVGKVWSGARRGQAMNEFQALLGLSNAQIRSVFTAAEQVAD